MLKASVITASDKGFAKEREDVSGTVVQEILKENGYEVVSYEILPDDQAMLRDAMKKICDEGLAHLIITTGGTGFSKRDVTPEATLDVIERSAFGIAEAMRLNSLTITSRAMLSRGVAGICKETLIVNLPGSPKAVKENLEYAISAITHGVEILLGIDFECGKTIHNK
jgi:molybdenum cofactor synthesis domain-containing protein